MWNVRSFTMIMLKSVESSLADSPCATPKPALPPPTIRIVCFDIELEGKGEECIC